MNKEHNAISENKVKPNLLLELFVILALGIVVYMLAARYDFLEQIIKFSRQYENWELDEFIIVAVFFVVALALFSVRRWRELRIVENELTQRNENLQKALSEINQLKGIIPICSACKKIRDDDGFWHQVEVYVRDRTEVDFTHGICPDCRKKLYSKFVKEEEKSEGKSY